jgi:quinoprotein dehydrogenase-associated probable ABC transporter substrate-binding protein
MSGRKAIISSRVRGISVAFFLLTIASLAGPLQAEERKVLRVCADPNNLPYSNQAGEGFENRLAEMVAGELALPIEYTWFPQRRGFTRHTLRAKVQGGGYKCDIIMGVPAQFELGIPTKPYYRSTYALVYPKGRGLDQVSTGDEFVNLDADVRDKLRVGVFAGTSASLWLAQNGMHAQMVALPVLEADPKAYPGRIIENDLANGDLDAVVIWGPIAGYFAKHSKNAEMVVVPLKSAEGLQFDFAISSAVRYGEGDWKNQIEEIYARNGDKIDSLLAEYGVPTLPIGEVRGGDDDDND